MIPGQKKRDVTAIAMPNHIDVADFKCLYDSRRIVGHLLVRERPRSVWTMAVSPLVDADDPVLRGKIITLFRV